MNRRVFVEAGENLTSDAEARLVKVEENSSLRGGSIYPYQSNHQYHSQKVIGSLGYIYIYNMYKYVYILYTPHDNIHQPHHSEGQNPQVTHFTLPKTNSQSP